MIDGIDPEKTLDAQWVVDSETGERLLIDRKTNLIIVREWRCCDANVNYTGPVGGTDEDDEKKKGA